MRVNLLDLTVQYQALRKPILEAVTAVLDSQQLINGPAVAELEQAVGGWLEAKAVGVSSGSDALLCAMMALGVGGDEVIVPAFTFFATAGAVSRLGARPVFVDIEPETFNLDPGKLEAAITKRTRGIIPVHLFGQMAAMDPIMAIARRHDLWVIEDAAQAIGATQDGRQAGTVGTMGCFSFFPTKNLGGAGDGGMIVARDEKLAKALISLRNHGMEPKYYHHQVGGNFRLDTVQAAYLNVKLPHLAQWSAGRRANAAQYDRLLAEVAQVRVPHILKGNEGIYNQYVIRAERRDELKAYLADHGVGSEIYYPLGLHEQECFADLGYKRGDFPETEKAAEEVLALPIYAELSDEEIGFVAEQVKGFYANDH